MALCMSGDRDKEGELVVVGLAREDRVYLG
jgi:hypothetical protein